MKQKTDSRLQIIQELKKIADELKIIKSEMRSLKNDNRFLDIKIRALKSSIDDESALIKEQNIEFKDEILGEVKAMREELAVVLEQYRRHDDILEEHSKKITHLEATSTS